MPFNPEKLQTILDSAIDDRKIFGTSFALKVKGEFWGGASGNLHTESPFFIASTTKLFLTALVLKCRAEGTLDLEWPLGRFFQAEQIAGLNAFGGRDHSHNITIRQLLSHTSGIPDYFQDKDRTRQSFETRLLSGQDFGWTFDEGLDHSKSLKANFSPGSPGKARYSDTNFQILGRILELISGRSFQGLLEDDLLKPLNLQQTYLFTDPGDTRPAPLFYQNRPLVIPRAMVSFGPDGGMVSTAADLLTFLEAFFGGSLFPAAYLPEMQVWNPIFFPLKAGLGIQLFKLPRLFDPLGQMPPLLGHSGLSGCLAYASPGKMIFVAGTVNQIAYPDTSFRLALRLIRSALRK